MNLHSLLAHPATRGLALDDPRTTQLRRSIIRNKRFLRRLYEEWYDSLGSALPKNPGPALEIGSGGGFMPEVIPMVVGSELFYAPGVELLCDAQHMPFASGSLQGILALGVLHHIPQPRLFFAEAIRCLTPGGVVALIEPWVSTWSRVVYSRFHHEGFEPQAPAWSFDSTGPLSGANQALPWIVFERDRALFEHEYPQLALAEIQLLAPFRYILSGGVSMRSLMPSWSFAFWRSLETLMTPWLHHFALFAKIVLRRVDGEHVAC